MTFTILIPIHNEAETINSVITEIKKTKFQGLEKIIIVDDGSTDESFNILKKQTQIKTLHFQTRKGKGAAIRHGLKRVQSDFTLLMDGDGQNSCNDIANFIRTAKIKKAELVVGSRFQDKSAFKKNNNLNYFGNLFFTKLLNLLFKKNVSDSLSGMRLLKTSKFPASVIKSKGFEIETELLIFAFQNNYRIETIEIKYHKRGNGESKFCSFKDGFKIFNLILFKYFSSLQVHFSLRKQENEQ